MSIFSTITCPHEEAQSPIRNSSRSALRDQGRVILWSIDVQSHKGIGHREVLNMVQKTVFDVARVAGCGFPEKALDHLAARDVRMPMLAGELRDDSPDLLFGGVKCFAEGSDRCGGRRRAIHKRNDSGVPAAAKYFAQSDLQGTELSAAPVWIDQQRCTVCIGKPGQGCLG